MMRVAGRVAVLLVLVLLAPILALTGCGSNDDALPDLVLTSHLNTTEQLDVATGHATSLGQVVTGDRPVLLWYWSPT